MYQNNNLQAQRGVSLYMTFMVMTMLLGIGLGMSALLLSQLDTLRGIGYSVLAFYATDAGIEKIVYDDQKGVNILTQCPEGGSNPACTATLSSGATFVITVSGPGPGCLAAKYCAKSVGAYQQARRAVRVGR